MADWSEGYMAEIGYTYGYYPELNPGRIKLAFLNAGYAFPEVGTACELGFGQGVSTNLHAAASITRWYGTDFNPAQAAFAQELAAAGGAGAALFDDAFDAFCTRSDLPDFDYIALHGIWSWISDANRAVIADFIRRKLKVGGVLYISYNTQPGWAAMAPMRELMAEHAALMGAPANGIVPRIEAALGFAQKLLQAGAGYGKANPSIATRLDSIAKQDRQYLAHEYFNRDWMPVSFARMSHQLSELKLTYACSAYLLDHIDAINLSAEQLRLLEEVPDRMFRESVRDFVVNQQFRRDYWVRGARTMPMLERAEQLRALRFVLGTARKDVQLKAKGTLGEANLNAALYTPLLDLLGDYRARSFHEIEQALAGQGINFLQIMQMVTVLSGTGVLGPVQDDDAIAAATPRTAALNRRLRQHARASNTIPYHASPLTGGGVVVARVEQLFLLAREAGSAEPAEWARFALDLFAQQGEKVLRAGQPIEAADEQLAELVRQAHAFHEFRLPLLKALRVAD
jgi:SAM-dependent methyltransferase